MTRDDFWHVANRVNNYQCQHRRGRTCHNVHNEERSCEKKLCPLMTKNQCIIRSMDNEVIVISRHYDIPTAEPRITAGKRDSGQITLEVDCPDCKNLETRVKKLEELYVDEAMMKCPSCRCPRCDALMKLVDSELGFKLIVCPECSFEGAIFRVGD